MTLRNVLALAALGLAATAVTAADALAVDLLAHRAGYHMSLAEARRASGIVAARGSMVYTFERRCDGWTVENNTHLRLVYEGGRLADTAWTFASWESADGQSFRFHALFKEDGVTVERIAGRAELSDGDGGGDGGGTAWLSQPNEREIPLPPGTMFPTEHLAAVIDAAQRGETSLARIVFDGASLENPYLVNAFFGPLTGAPRPLAAAAEPAPHPVWWSRLAFFPNDTDSVLPEFELGARYASNGVADRVTQHFDDFVLKVRLDAFESLPDPDC